MSAPIEPGMWVEVVDASPNPRTGDVGITLGAVYRVERTKPWPSIRAGLAVWLVGVRRPNCTSGGYGAHRFRPIDRRTTELFRSWLTDLPADLDVREPAVAAPSGRAPHEVHPAFREDQ